MSSVFRFLFYKLFSFIFLLGNVCEFYDWFKYSYICTGMVIWNTWCERIFGKWSKVSLFYYRINRWIRKLKYRFWNLLEPYTSQRILQMKSLTTFFSDGCGENFYIHGLVSFRSCSFSYWEKYFNLECNDKFLV